MLYPLSCAAPYWAKVHPTELHITPNELANPRWAMLYPTELCWTLLSYTVPYWAMLYPTELRNTIWATLRPNWAINTASTFTQFCHMPECRVVRYLKKGTPVRYRNATVPYWDAGCRNTDAGGFGLDADAQLCQKPIIKAGIAGCKQDIFFINLPSWLNNIRKIVDYMCVGS